MGLASFPGSALRGRVGQADSPLSAAAQALVHQTEDHEEAVTAFFGKRKPAFSGR